MTPLLWGVALAAQGLVDAGDWRAATEEEPRPAALLVLSPDLLPEAGDPLARALERGGWDAWRLDLADTAPGDAVALTVPAAVAELQARGAPVLVVGEGLGGRIAARSAAEGLIHPQGLALLGAPLDLDYAGEGPVALVGWMLALPLPDEPLDLATRSELRWGEFPALELLLAYSPSGPFRLPSMRWRVPPGSFLRLGLLNIDPREPDHAGLLTDPASARSLLRWARPLRRAGGDPG